jgi:glycosyltransferase involved in cell wall biosynthesis
MSKQHFVSPVASAHELSATGSPARHPGDLSILERARTASIVLETRLIEWLQFESPFRGLVAVGGMAVGTLLYLARRPDKAMAVFSTLHRAAYSAPVSRLIEWVVRSRRTQQGARVPAPSLDRVYRDYVGQLAPVPVTAKFFDDPHKMLGPLATVVKSAAKGEKGIVVLQYSHNLPVFAKLFDLETIATRYYIVLEPTWSGFCDLNVLCYARHAFPVFVQAYEPRDAEFVRGMQSNLHVIPTSSNWWVDHRVFRPLPGVAKDVDLIMVAAWGDYKRHDRFLAALRTLRRRGIEPRVVLVGYPLGMSREDILRRARFYGVLDQIECHEGLTQEQVNHHLNRARVNIIWSRKEGVNRAIIEGMFAGVPCIIREGFNYGYRYPYVNGATGCFSTEAGLPDTIVRMLDTHAEYAPRDWAMANMSCQRATGLLEESIGQVARAAGEPWTGEVAVKLNGLDSVSYWDDGSLQRFAPDYDFLRSAVRRS